MGSPFLHASPKSIYTVRFARAIGHMPLFAVFVLCNKAITTHDRESCQ